MSTNSINTLCKPSFKKGNNYWAELIGRSDDFRLESKIFHSISICLILLAFIYIPYNLISGYYSAAISASIIVIFFTYQYYHSRFLGKSHNSVAFGLMGILIFGVNYFFHSGISGSTDLIWPVYLLLVLAISPYHQHIKWLILYILVFLAIHILEYQLPSLVKHPFKGDFGLFIDRITIFPIPAMVIFVIITFIRQSYDREKRATQQKTIDLELSYQQISLQKNQLAQSNLEKDKLMSIISHDLRSPLISIQNYLELLNEYDLDSTERQGLEKTLMISTNNAIEMLSNLLSWSKSQMDGVHVNLQKSNLFKLIHKTLEMEKIHALKKNITLSHQIPSEIIVMADVDMLQMVIRNLISNAIKFTPIGGAISVTAQLSANECKLSVVDNGKGISEDKKNAIFTIMAKPAYGTNREKGVGLGLVLCKEFIELQGGRIGFESTLNTGSNFFIFIPIAQS